MGDYSTILVISDTQAPHHHQDTIPFLKEVKKQFKPTFVIQIGDLGDFQGLNFHCVNPNMPSAKEELVQLRTFVSHLAKVFSELHMVDSNHDAIPRRKARLLGLPDEMMKDYLSLIEAPSTWTFASELLLKLPNGIRCKFKHNFSSNLYMDSIKQGMSLVCGHFHSKSNVHWWQNDKGLNFSMQVGCLIDDESPAFDYNKTQAIRPVLTVGIIKNGIPFLIPMYVNKRNRWVGFI